MKKTELHKLNAQELTEEAKRLRKQLFDMRTQAVTEKLENPMQIRNLKRELAQLLTEQRSRQLQAKA